MGVIFIVLATLGVYVVPERSENVQPMAESSPSQTVTEPIAKKLTAEVKPSPRKKLSSLEQSDYLAIEAAKGSSESLKKILATDTANDPYLIRGVAMALGEIAANLKQERDKTQAIDRLEELLTQETNSGQNNRGNQIVIMEAMGKFSAGLLRAAPRPRFRDVTTAPRDELLRRLRCRRRVAAHPVRSAQLGQTRGPAAAHGLQQCARPSVAKRVPAHVQRRQALSRS